ncbi:hypothetical protein D3C73_805360 [compost metagenome]
MGTLRHALISEGWSRGLMISTLRIPACMPYKPQTVMANTWYSGSALMIVSWVSDKSCTTGCATASVCSTLAVRFRCDSIAPLGTPVVPPVYCSTATSSIVSVGGVNGKFAPVAKTFGSVCAPSMLQAGTIFLIRRATKLTSGAFRPPSRSPGAVTTTCLSWPRFFTACKVCAKFSRIKMTDAPLSCNWRSSSSAVYSGFTFTTTSPARKVPSMPTR